MRPLVLENDGFKQLHPPEYYLLEAMSLGTKELVPLINNSITITKSRVLITLGLGSNKLYSIFGGGDGFIVVLQSQVNLTIKDNTDNLRLTLDFIMDTIYDTIVLIKDGSNWLELMRSNNA